MQHWRILVLALLFTAPLLLLTGLGVYHLIESGWWSWFWVPLTAFLAGGYYLAWRWQRGQRLLRLDFTAPLHWTDRDREAWKLVEGRAKAAEKLPPDQLSQMQFYVEAGQQLAFELAAFYHPGAKDPVGALTIPEILAVIELAVHDLAEMVDKYLPGGHLLTINDWRRAKKVADWYRTVSNVGWLISGLFAPVNTGVRYLASHVGLTMPWQKLQFNLLVWFYSAFVHRLGTYLIDLHSGRLRVGARRYQELVQAAQGEAGADGTQTAGLRGVTITVLGQSKVGKSSLINALLGEQKAKTDVVRTTEEITRYQLQPEGVPAQLVILDTVGYGHTGPAADQVRGTQEAACQADVVFLVLHARNPGRQGDLEMLQELTKFFSQHPELKLPPILGVLTHIDLLSPALEWDPPYHWQQPQRPKEQQIDQAVAAVREQLGDFLAGVVPVCAAPQKEYGLQEWLLPALVELLQEARAVALLRCLKGEADAGKIAKVFGQLAAAGKDALKILWHSAGKK